jgi:mono/diheme cytochrome c family protein
MRKPVVAWVVLAVAVIVAAVLLAAFATNLSALPEPGRLETWLAARARAVYLRRAAAHVPPPPAVTPQRIEAGAGAYGMACAFCHGADGRHPTAVGQNMYPRAVSLASPAVQALSDRELFAVIHDGLRLTGMPGFGRIESDDDIWNLVFYIRTLATPPAPAPAH